MTDAVQPTAAAPDRASRFTWEPDDIEIVDDGPDQGATAMPYHISDDGKGNSVLGEDGQPVEGGAHPDHESAVKHLAALEANVPDAHKAIDAGDMPGQHWAGDSKPNCPACKEPLAVDAPGHCKCAKCGAECIVDSAGATHPLAKVVQLLDLTKGGNNEPGHPFRGNQYGGGQGDGGDQSVSHEAKLSWKGSNTGQHAMPHGDSSALTRSADWKAYSVVKRGDGRHEALVHTVDSENQFNTKTQSLGMGHTDKEAKALAHLHYTGKHNAVANPELWAKAPGNPVNFGKDELAGALVKALPADARFDLFVPITKIDLQRREVWGTGALEQADHSDEIMDYNASKPRFEKWSEAASLRTGGKSLGNVREMHQPIAAGKLIAFQPKDLDKRFDVGVQVLDDSTWRKVEGGVLTGFSVGGDYGRRWRDGKLTRYEALPTELSLVDAPCMPGATFQHVIKADGTAGQPLLLKGGLGTDRISIVKVNWPKPPAEIPAEAVGTPVEQVPNPQHTLELNPASPPTGAALQNAGAASADLTSQAKSLMAATPIRKEDEPTMVKVVTRKQFAKVRPTANRVAKIRR